MKIVEILPFISVGLAGISVMAFFLERKFKNLQIKRNQELQIMLSEAYQKQLDQLNEQIEILKKLDTCLEHESILCECVVELFKDGCDKRLILSRLDSIIK